MKSGAILSTSILALLLGTAGFAGAQNGRARGHEEGGPHGQQGNFRQHESEHDSQAQHGNRGNGPEHHYEQSRESHEAYQREPERHVYGTHGPVEYREVRRDESGPRYIRQDVWERQRAHDWHREHRGWHDRGGYYGYRIPDERFHAHFGRGHWFRVHEVPVVVVEGYPRFQFGGYWFSVVDPCPETWSPAWYRTDDVYVDYVNDGYYMYNRQHPGIAIAINVSL
jgi:hypothetical protein